MCFKIGAEKRNVTKLPYDDEGGIKIRRTSKRRPGHQCKGP